MDALTELSIRWKAAVGALVEMTDTASAEDFEKQVQHVRELRCKIEEIAQEE